MNDTDYSIAEAILDNCNDGLFDIEVELGNNTFDQVSGYIETDRYQEDDFHCGYGNGTGAWITTYASVCICNLELCAFDDGGNETHCELEAHERDRRLLQTTIINLKIR